MDNQQYNVLASFVHARTHLSPDPVEEEPTIQQKRRRASYACKTCRARKVRCNVQLYGHPCGNCEHAEIECTLPITRMEKNAFAKAQNRQKHASKFVVLSDYRENNSEHPPTQHLQSQHPPLQHSPSRHPPIPSDPQISSNASHHNYDALSYSTSENTTSLLSRLKLLTSSPLASVPPHQPQTSSFLPLPQIFADFPVHLDESDLAYLQQHDACTLPPEPLQSEILKAYLELVDPSFPVIDLESTLFTIKFGYEYGEEMRYQGTQNGQIANKRIQLLLFQAIMLAGVRLVSMKALREAGYTSRESAIRIFFSRVKVLYNFDTYTDRLSLIQSLLLMALVNLPPYHDDKGASHWLDLAISFSYQMGLHRKKPHPRNRHQNAVEKRVWWMAVVLDRTLSPNPDTLLSRSWRIKHEDSDVEILSLEDFDLDDGYVDDDQGLDSMKVRQNALLCIEKATICWRADGMSCCQSSGDFPIHSDSASSFARKQNNLYIQLPYEPNFKLQSAFPDGVGQQPLAATEYPLESFSNSSSNVDTRSYQEDSEGTEGVDTDRTTCSNSSFSGDCSIGGDVGKAGHVFEYSALFGHFLEDNY